MQQTHTLDQSDEESQHSSIEQLRNNDLTKSIASEAGGWSIGGTFRRGKVAVAVLLAVIFSIVFVALGVSLKHNDGQDSIISSNSTKSNTENRTTTPSTPATPSTLVTPTPAPAITQAPTYRSPSTLPSSVSDCPTYANGLERSPLAGKRGIAFTMREPGEQGSYEENLPKVLALEPYWFYSWSSTVPEQVRQSTGGIEYVPMIWGAWSSSGLASSLNQLANDTRVQRILGFNEPDQAKQSNMNSTVALRYWEQIESTLPHIPLVSPACAHPDGEWMQDFMSGWRQAQQVRAKDTNGCNPIEAMEHVAVHWYGPANVETFQESIQLYRDLYNKSLMITEFAVADWEATSAQENRYSRYDVLEFMKSILPWLESQSWIAAYAWFPFDVTEPVGTSSSLFDRDGNLTRLGMYYQSVTNANQVGNQSIVEWNGYS